MDKSDLIKLLQKSLYGFIAIFYIALLYTVYRTISTTVNLSDNVIITLIGALAGFSTILGSVLVAQKTAATSAKLQREMEARRLKQEYYHNFIEALSIKLAFQEDLTSIEGYEANKTFCTETNRLPLYASQEVVEMVNKFAGGGVPPEFSRFYALIRKDLCSSSYEDYKDLKQIYFQIPNKQKTNN